MRDELNGRETRSAGFAVAAVFIAALYHPTRLLGDLLDQERRLTGGAGLIYGAIPQCIFAFRISAARVE